jgi:hypothetical protein
MSNSKKPEFRDIVLPTVVYVLVGIGIIIGGYLGREWIRESFIPYGPPSYFARKSLEKAYAQAYESVKQPAADLQIVLDPRVTPDCHLFAAQGIQTRISCYAGSGDGIQIQDEYISSFKQFSAGIEAKILESGWTKVHNAAQPINELFDNPDNDVSIGVNYEKKYRKNTCTLSLFYNAYQKNPNELRYSLSCYRYINFLGNPDE